MDQNVGREGAKALAEAMAKNAAAAIVQKTADDIAPNSKIGVVARAEETTKASDVERNAIRKDEPTVWNLFDAFFAKDEL